MYYDPSNLYRDPPCCPYCDRVMSKREAAEQAACNDCHELAGGRVLR